MPPLCDLVLVLSSAKVPDAEWGGSSTDTSLASAVFRLLDDSLAVEDLILGVDLAVGIFFGDPWVIGEELVGLATSGLLRSLSCGLSLRCV